MPLPMMYREQQQLQALRGAREVLRELAGNAGDDAFWNEGGKGYKTVEELGAALAAAESESMLEQMPSPQMLVLLQLSLATAYQALQILIARKPAAGQGIEMVLDALLAESLKHETPGADLPGDLPGFQTWLATLRGVVDIACDRSRTTD